MNYELVKVETPEDWDTYHRIRREELFEARGRIGVYDPNRPEEKTPENFPFLLKYKREGIGTTRLDTRPDKTAVVRLVAITKKEQGKGHGRKLAALIEEFAQEHGIKKFLVNAHPSAVGYYEKMGYVREDWDPTELTGISEDAIQMSKVLFNKD